MTNQGAADAAWRRAQLDHPVLAPDPQPASLSPEQIARVVHEANRAVQIEQADPTIPVSKPWDILDAETRASALDGVLAVQRGATPRESHENWVRFKEAHGWILGQQKNDRWKTHPLLLPYDLLPESQRVKDRLFVAIVAALTE